MALVLSMRDCGAGGAGVGGMLLLLEGGGCRTGLGGDGCRWPKEGMGLVLVMDGGG